MRYVASASTTCICGRFSATKLQTFLRFSQRYFLSSSSHGSPFVNAATAAVMANAFGSATSSVFNARHTLWRKNLFGTITAAVCKPAILKHLVGAIQVMLISAQSSDAAANGTYDFPGAVMSQCISSDMTVTLCFLQSAPIFASSSFVQMIPHGL